MRLTFGLFRVQRWPREQTCCARALVEHAREREGDWGVRGRTYPYERAHQTHGARGPLRWRMSGRKIRNQRRLSGQQRKPHPTQVDDRASRALAAVMFLQIRLDGPSCAHAAVWGFCAFQRVCRPVNLDRVTFLDRYVYDSKVDLLPVTYRHLCYRCNRA